MKTIDYSQYSVTKLDDKNFTVDSLDAGFVAVPEGEETLFAISNEAGDFAVVTLERSGTNLAIKQLRYSTSGATIPTFSGSTKAYSTLGADVINQDFGEGILVCAGESNMQGGQIIAPNPEIDAVYDSITQYRYQSFQNDGTTSRGDERFNLKLRDASDDVHLYWPKQAGLGSAMVTSVTHAANSLARYAGIKYQQLMLGAEWATSIGPMSGGAGDPGGQWDVTGNLYIRLRDMTINALNRNPNNYLSCFYMMLGVNDATYGTTPDATLEADYAALQDNMLTTFMTQVGAATGRDLSRTPIVLVTMPISAVQAQGVRGTRINDAILDTPNRLPWVSVIDTGDMTVHGVDTAHWRPDELREIGAERFPTKYFEALGNYQTGVVTPTLSASASGTASNSGDLNPTAIPLSASASGTATNSGDLTPGGVDTTLSASASGTATNSGDLSVGSGGSGVALDMLVLKGTGLDPTTGNLLTWADQSAGSGDLNTTGVILADKPNVNAGGFVEFDGVSEYAKFPTDLASDITNGTTFILDFSSSDDGTGNPYFFGGEHFGFRASLGNIFFLPYYAFGGIATTETVASLCDGTRKTIEIVISGPGGSAEMFVDGVSVGSGTAASNASDGFHIGSNEHWGSFAELEVYNIAVAKRALTTQERADVIAQDFIT